MESNLFQLENKLENKLESQLENKLESKPESKQTNSLITICYNKKWLIVLGVLIILLILYIYIYDINMPSFCIPINTKYNLFNSKNTNNKSCDDIIELTDTDDWNLENEIKDFMELEDNYIQLSSN